MNTQSKLVTIGPAQIADVLTDEQIKNLINTVDALLVAGIELAITYTALGSNTPSV